MKTFEWRNTLAMGNAGAKVVRDWLKKRGHTVQSVEKSAIWRQRDVDFLVDGSMVEVKTDSHQPNALFAEVTVDGKPGYVFKTRADTLLYYWPAAEELWWVDMPKLAWLVFQQRAGFKVFQVQSNRYGRTWLAEGVRVELEALQAIGAVQVFHLDGEDDEEQAA